VKVHHGEVQAFKIQNANQIGCAGWAAKIAGVVRCAVTKHFEFLFEIHRPGRKVNSSKTTVVVVTVPARPDNGQRPWKFAFLAAH
jgi:hypothetical protein